MYKYEKSNYTFDPGESIIGESTKSLAKDVCVCASRVRLEDAGLVFLVVIKRGEVSNIAGIGLEGDI